MPTTPEDLKQLTMLGSKDAKGGTIELFPNHAANRLQIKLLCSEFTSLCPLTKQPDFAEIEIDYEPDKWVAETKSVKLFLESYREVGIFNEHLAVELAEKFMARVEPFEVTVAVRFKSRGGIAISTSYRLVGAGLIPPVNV